MSAMARAACPERSSNQRRSPAHGVTVKAVKGVVWNRCVPPGPAVLARGGVRLPDAVFAERAPAPTG